ncbi:hypothetical protein [Maribacter aestuarii]|uniref:hypothetical protein n=1 Tax=Maribacter aestuarii TaxID=1130723 RepID=UPI00248C59A0|nr:hypothetical protein [Maribacter aestuarii]
MKTRIVLPLLLCLVGVLIASTRGPSSSEYDLAYLQKNDSKVSNPAFDKMMDVLTHQRCMNCHPNDNIPKQGDDSHPHYFDMARGDDNMGFQATQCATCHQSENNEYSGVPGAPHWSLAPASMGWQGLSRIEIAEQLLDKETNGGKTHEELIEHMTEDELVLWAWKPGVDADGNMRTPPPVSEEEFAKAVKEWFKDGARIPSK